MDLPPVRRKAARAAACGAAVLVLVAACTSERSDPLVDATPAPTLPTATTGPTTRSAPTTPPATATAPSPSASPDELSQRPGLESPPPIGVPTCKGSALTITDADTVVVPRWRHEFYVVRTTGPDCQLSGYPTVAFRDASGGPMAIGTQRGGFGLHAEDPPTVTLSRTTTVSFAIGSPRDGSCADVAHVLVRLPGTSTTHKVATQQVVCGSRAGLSPVERRTEEHDD